MTIRSKDKVLLNTSGETARIIVDSDDPMEIVIECPNCGHLTKYGQTRMISGYVGCDNAYLGGICYWDDLLPRILKAKTRKDEELYQAYCRGELYSKHMKEE